MNNIYLPSFQAITSVAGLSDVDLATLNELLAVWRAKLPKNVMRLEYADGRNKLQNLNIAIPPSLSEVETVVGWPGMAVEKLSEICLFDKVSYGDGSDPYGLNRLLEDNRFDIEVQQGIGSGLIHSLALVSTTLGGPGEPDVLISFHSAMWSAGVWDKRRRALSSAMFVNATDDLGCPIRVTLFTLRETVVIAKGSGWYVEDVIPNVLIGRLPVEPLPYRPTLDRPLGRSKINRAVRSITNEAMRSVLRSEISAEFYSAPQRYVLGADEKSFVDESGNPIPAWKALIGYVMALGRDKDGNTPTVGQFPQQSQQPHTEQLKEAAARFASAANLELSTMGIVQDNPSSAEAIEKGDRHLKRDADAAIRGYRVFLKRVMQNTLMVREGLSVLPDAFREFDPQFLPTSNLTGDEAVKLTTAMPWLSESEVLMEKLGWDEGEIRRVMMGRERRARQQLLQQLGAAAPALAVES